MNKASEINKIAWEYRAYEYWHKCNGTPEECAECIKADPLKKLKSHGKYFEDVEGLKIANPCGSCGRRAVALALLGARVTVFDISKENERYARELAEKAQVPLEYVVGDFYDIDLTRYEGDFDMVYLEGGVLHYFHDIKLLMAVLSRLLKKGGGFVLSDFHPFRKIVPINFFKSSIKDYFNCQVIEGELAYKSFFTNEEQQEFPKCSLRLYTISEILNSTIEAGFIIKEFNEEPSWTDETLPGEFTIYAIKE